VWSSQPTDAAAGATLWLVPADAPGLSVVAPFGGLGLRGNASSPVLAEDVDVPLTARLGADGAGRDIALGVALPTFQILNASGSLGMMDAAIDKAIAHATSARLEHLDQTLADEPVTRQHLASMRVGGGAAFRRDVGIERHFRDARAAAVMAPTQDALQEFIGRAVCGMALFG
jgi:isovaleryl-CoA dehydrogenase